MVPRDRWLPLISICAGASPMISGATSDSTSGGKPLVPPPGPPALALAVSRDRASSSRSASAARDVARSTWLLMKQKVLCRRR